MTAVKLPTDQTGLRRQRGTGCANGIQAAQREPMTVNVARRRSKAKPAMTATETRSMAIGEIGQTVFGCPSCARPLAVGVRRCPGCLTRMVMGVQVGRAGTFVMVGLILGVAFGGGLGAFLSAVRLPAHDAQIAEVAAAAALAQVAAVQAAASPVAHASPTIPSTGGGTSATIPAISASALSQALVLDARLSDSTRQFTDAMAAPTLDVLTVSQLLRNASADSVIGLQLAQNLSAWSGGSSVGGRLATFYTAVQATAAEGLGASIRNQEAYRRSAEAMVELLGGIGSIDGQARSLATRAGISLP
jgi:hypothetical protein